MRVKLILSFLFIFISVVLSAQGEVRKVEILPPVEKLSVPFYCDSIIDNRVIKRNIGMIRKGLNQTNRPIILNGPFKETIKKHINNDLLFSFDNSEGLVLIFHEFNISKPTNKAFGSPVCRIEIEFAKMQGADLYSFGSYYSESEKNIPDSIDYYSAIIHSSLLNCIKDFITDGYTSQELKLIQLSESDLEPFDLSKLPELAYYDSFNSLRANKPMDYFKARLLLVNAGQSVQHFKVKAKDKQDRKKNIVYLKYNEELYIHATSYINENYLVKAKQVGRFIYFEDRYSNSTAAVAFGAIGYAASNTMKSLIIDTNTGLLEVITPKTLPYFIKNYPEIKNYWSRSEKKHEDIEEVFARLNQETK